MRAFFLTVLALVLIVVGGPWAWVRVEAHDKIYTVTQAPERDVALVLGAGLNADGTPSTYLEGRLDIAEELYNQGKVSVIVVSGDNRSVDYSEPDAMRTYLVQDGIPASDVVADYAGLNTYDSCYRARNIFGITSATVIGQSYHIDRAVTACQYVGIDTIGVADEQDHSTTTWRSGVVREFGSNIKLVWDLVTQREPTMGQQESSVQDALARHGK